MEVEKSQIVRIASGFAEVVAHISFKLFKDEEFRKLVKFHDLDQTEQDRIFNELEVSFLGLMHLYLDELRISLDKEEEQKFVFMLQESLDEGFLSIMKDLGIEDRFLKQWKVLIGMRFDEYSKDFEMLKIEFEKEGKPKKSDPVSVAQLARVQTILLDMVTHIRRGDLKAGDPLIKFLRKWVIQVEHLFADSIKKAIFHPKAVS